MKGVLLDGNSLGPGMDFSSIRAQLSELVIWPATQPEAVAERITDAEVLLVNKVYLGRNELLAAQKLQLICVLATGMNNIDLNAAAELGIPVRNVQAYGTASVAQHTLMLMLALATRLPLYQRSVAAGEWQQSPAFCLMQHPVTQLAGKTLLLVGHGELGREVERLAQAFGMQVQIAARPGNTQDHRPALDSLLPLADVISFHCPLNTDTHNLLNAERLQRVKSDLLVVNAARGGIVNETDALNALREGRIGGLAVDVLSEEPPVRGNPLLDALNEPLNLIITPHSAWLAPEARQKILDLTAQNIAALKH
ncbi:D-2-hydroxyacid dehydrogenase [Marinospirillum alkaliphilum]|uniref:Glycerate dehydrogenase n=1 Tax=Marinospirillum alkaliphilum DSM 21637 TaxID=1122209 RepID=A0A1K1V2S6_9GAMM|nr:D-2-hydroxyacid dehydrogenase [Marinospirillum alkaliphilum]SFX19426.1 glycerate dehydrogenase [Marinospirillum alkaliphilum DSM 21637]